MKRRDFVTYAGATLCQAMLPAATRAAGTPPATTTPADITLRIAPVALEIAPSHFISTIGYNGTSPGPILRMREGKPVTVDVINDTDAAEFVHWHGLMVPAAVDGAEEEGTPSVPAGGRRRYQFTPKPAGTRWYHSHAMAMGDLHRGSYTGQYGFLMIDSGTNPGRYDQEIFLALRDWEPFYTDQFVDMDEAGTPPGPQPEKPARLDTRANGLEPISQVYSINEKALGAGEPIRVRQGTRVLVHLLNASALENRTIALPGHEFHVLALDGNPVPTPGPAKVITLGPGERVDAYIEMNRPGVWILGATDDMIRNAGLGVVIEYANQHREPQWVAQPNVFWDYTKFGRPIGPSDSSIGVAGTAGGAGGKAPPHVIDMVFEKIPGGSRPFNLWTINGKPYPHEREFVLQHGQRYRINFRNRTDDSHPVHLHRHLFELIDVNGKATRGIMKDTVIVPLYGRVSVDLLADQPGLSLFHCHIQAHMDYGFKALFRYA